MELLKLKLDLFAVLFVHRKVVDRVKELRKLVTHVESCSVVHLHVAIIFELSVFSLVQLLE